MKNDLILVVEDDVISCMLFKEIFERENITSYLFVTDGEQAIEICKIKQNIQLVLMDYKLPGINGCEALREIRKFRKDLPVVAQSACVYYGDKELFINCGFDDYLSKPIIAQELISIVNRYCNCSLN